MSKQEFFERLQNGLNAAQDRLDELQKLKIARSFQADKLECFLFEINPIDTTLPLEFTDRFWNNLMGCNYYTKQHEEDYQTYGEI